MTVLSNVRKYFPKVEEVQDAVEDVLFQVKAIHTQIGVKKAKRKCPIAWALRETLGASGVVVGKTTIFVVHDKVATRYRNHCDLMEQLISFDYGFPFVPGEYKIWAPQPSVRIGAHKSPRLDKTGPQRRPRWEWKKARTSLLFKEAR